MFFVLAFLKNSEIQQENIGGGVVLQVSRNASLTEIYSKLILLINTTMELYY